MSMELVSPEEVGVDPRRLAVFLERARLDVDNGALPSVQVAVAAQGRLVAFETYGDSSNEKRYILQPVVASSPPPSGRCSTTAWSRPTSASPS
jgi:hypothetical protein